MTHPDIKVAKWASKCPLCDVRIPIGSGISLTEAGWAHAECEPATDRMTRWLLDGAKPPTACNYDEDGLMP